MNVVYNDNSTDGNNELQLPNSVDLLYTELFIEVYISQERNSSKKQLFTST